MPKNDSNLPLHFAYPLTNSRKKCICSGLQFLETWRRLSKAHEGICTQRFWVLCYKQWLPQTWISFNHPHQPKAVRPSLKFWSRWRRLPRSSSTSIHVTKSPLDLTFKTLQKANQMYQLQCWTWVHHIVCGFPHQFGHLQPLANLFSMWSGDKMDAKFWAPSLLIL